MKMQINKYIALILAGSLLLAGCVSGPAEPENPSVATTLPTEMPTAPIEPEGIKPIAPTITAKEPNDTDMVRVKDYIPDIQVELKYATSDNFTGQVIYTFTEAYLRYGTVKKLMKVQSMLKPYGLGLKLWDAYRPLYGQQALWDAYPDSNYVSQPGTGVRAHCRGHAVDITLVDIAGNEVEMPSGFDDFTARGDKEYSDCTPEATEHSRLLDNAMRAGGFYGYRKEWWHYVDYDNYSIEELFDPTAVSAWYANSEEPIPLRIGSSTAIGPYMHIGRGEMVTLLGWKGDFAYVDYAGYRGFVEIKDILPVES